MNLGKLASTALSAIGLVADVLALKVLNGTSPSTQAFLARITGGFVTKEACAARARNNAARLDIAFPYVTRLLGQTPSRLITTITHSLADSAAARAQQLAQDLEHIVSPIGRRLGELLPDARENPVNK